MAWEPSGTETETSKVALSSGWSLDGNHQAADSGCCAATPPSGVRCHAVHPSIFTSDGLPAYRTTTETGRSFGSGTAGVISSSCEPDAVNAAFRPFTRTSSAFRPRSRLKRDRFCVGVARIVAVPSSRSVDGWYFSRRS